jgi:YD repeat-containing protein
MADRESLRLAALRSYDVLDTAPEEIFDRLTELAAEVFDAPIALVSLIDKDRQWFKSRHGLDAESTPREWAFCDHAIRQAPRSVMVVENALEDPRFRDNPLVKGEPDIRFYAGAVITGSDNQNLGTLCVIDRRAREATSKDLARLKTLAGLVANELELRRATRRIVEFQLATERALQRLVEQANRARLAESIAGLGHYRLDLATGQLSWSDQMYLIHGMQPGEPLELNAVQRLIHPEDRAMVGQWMETLQTTGVGPRIDLRINRIDGEAAYLVANGAVETDANGAIKAVVGTVWDVTVLKLQAIEADEAREEALQARHEAEDAAAVKAEFLANMSHELRTPLTSILGFMNLAAQQPELGELARTYLARGGDAGQALLCTVNDVLDFSKLEAGQVRFNLQPVSLSVLGRTTLDLFSPQAGAKDLTLTFEMEGPDRVTADPDRMRQVLLNLVGNAIKFTEAGGVTLRFRYDAQAERLEACITDTGAGIPATKIEHLFKRFAQVDGAFARSGGTGLGLSICKGLIEAQAAPSARKAARAKAAASGSVCPWRPPLRARSLWPCPWAPRCCRGSASWWPTTIRLIASWPACSWRAWAPRCRRRSTATTP